MVSLETVPQEVPVTRVMSAFRFVSVTINYDKLQGFRRSWASFLESSQNSKASGGTAAIHFFSVAGVEKAFLETTVSTETPVKAIPVRTGELVKLHP